MGSALYVKLDRAGRILRDILDNEGPLPQDMAQPLQHAFDDVEQSRGHERTYPLGYGKMYLGKFSPGDTVAFLLNSYPGPAPNFTEITPPVPDVMPARIIDPPKHRSPNDHEDMGSGKQWYFTSDLPVSVTMMVDVMMHVETPSDFREVYHLRGDHWSRWREKSGNYWSILTIFPET